MYDACSGVVHVEFVVTQAEVFSRVLEISWRLRGLAQETSTSLHGARNAGQRVFVETVYFDVDRGKVLSRCATSYLDCASSKVGAALKEIDPFRTQAALDITTVRSSIQQHWSPIL